MLVVLPDVASCVPTTLVSATSVAAVGSVAAVCWAAGVGTSEVCACVLALGTPPCVLVPACSPPFTSGANPVTAVAVADVAAMAAAAIASGALAVPGPDGELVSAAATGMSAAIGS